MKTQYINEPVASPLRRKQAFTLAEMMIALTIFGMVVAALIGLQIFGMKQNHLVESKLGASDQARGLLEKMGWEIRSAQWFEIGNAVASSGAFTEVPNGQPLKGTAVRLYSTAWNSNNYVQYYFNTNQRVLLRSKSGVTGSKVVVAGLTNNMSFQAENYRGIVQTNADDYLLWRNCIRVIIEIAQYKYPLTQVGPGSLYDYYKMEFKIAPYCPARL